ncbi:MAG: TIGR02300 family protein [Rhizobiaceae bacterium]|nr:TIGR02300 family protein [Rhizobiaceae bacterium]
MAKTELGTKRIDPETGRKFYDLGKDPIVSPYTGKSYPLSYFETAVATKSKISNADDDENEVETEEEGAEIVSLEEADDDAKGGDDLPDLEDDEDVDLGDDETVFLEEEEEDEDDVTGIVNVGDEDEQ